MWAQSSRGTSGEALQRRRSSLLTLSCATRALRCRAELIWAVALLLRRYSCQGSLAGVGIGSSSHQSKSSVPEDSARPHLCTNTSADSGWPSRQYDQLKEYQRSVMDCSTGPSKSNGHDPNLEYLRNNTSMAKLRASSSLIGGRTKHWNDPNNETAHKSHNKLYHSHPSVRLMALQTFLAIVAISAISLLPRKLTFSQKTARVYSFIWGAPIMLGYSGLSFGRKARKLRPISGLRWAIASAAKPTPMVIGRYPECYPLPPQ